MTSFDAPPTAAGLPDTVTPRLLLRRPGPGDLDPLAEVFARPEVWAFPFGRGRDRDETAAFLRRQEDHWDAVGFGLWLALDRDGRILGYAGLAVPTFLPAVLPAVEVGWRFHPDVWGRGLATEAARAALRLGFDRLGLTEILSLPEAENTRSVAVCRRLGMRLRERIPVAATAGRSAVVADCYALTREEHATGAA